MNNWEEKVFEGFEDEVKLYYCGKRLRNIAHHFGPYNLDKYLMYFIKEGTAELITRDGETITLGNGFFVNFPNNGFCYKCDDSSPWSIKWIMADGAVIEKYLSLLGVTRDKPYIKLRESGDIERVFDEMYENFDKNHVSNKIYCISLVHRLFSLLLKEHDRDRDCSRYVSEGQKLMEENYSDPHFSVERLSERLGLHPNYFSILYKKETGVSPKKKITSLRIEKACKMLKFTDKKIKEIAYENGFSDELYFSRVFTKALGSSPKEYRDRQKMEI